MKIEIVKLSKPYPFIKFKKDGYDYVFSFLNFYIRFKLKPKIYYYKDNKTFGFTDYQHNWKLEHLEILNKNHKF